MCRGNDQVRRNVWLLVPAAAAVLLPHTAAVAGEIAWSGGVTGIVQTADDRRAETEATLSVDLVATLPMGRGEWSLYLEGSTTPKSDGVSAFYPTVNGDAGSVLTRDGDGGVQVSEFNYTWRGEDEHALTLGLIDPSAWLDRSRIANDENQQFLNGSFINNATIEFPDYTLGGIFRSPANGARPEFTIVLSGSDGITDLPDRSYQDLLDFNEEGRGVFAGAGAHWSQGRSSWRLGAWVRSDDHAVAGSATEEEQNYGVYAVYGWRSGANALNLRAGLANPDVSVADEFVAVSYQRDLGFGQLGIGAAHTGISSGFRAGERNRAFDSELYLRLPIFGGAAHVTPSVQYVEVASFEASETVSGSTAIVSGIRFHYSF